MTEIDVVDYLLKKDKFFENSYDLYQDILYYLQHRDYDGFNKVINEEYKDVSKYMKTTLNTLKKHSINIKILYNIHIVMVLWKEIIILVNL